MKGVHNFATAMLLALAGTMPFQMIDGVRGRRRRARPAKGSKPWPKGKPRPGERALYRHGNRLTHALTQWCTDKNLARKAAA